MTKDERDACEGQINSLMHMPLKPLTRWETDFLESIQDQLTNKGFLSDKQKDILDKIYERKG